MYEKQKVDLLVKKETLVLVIPCPLSYASNCGMQY